MFAGGKRHGKCCVHAVDRFCTFAQWDYDFPHSPVSGAGVAPRRHAGHTGRVLSIGERTVQTHLGNVLTKLELSSRTQVALWAVREGLVRP